VLSSVTFASPDEASNQYRLKRPCPLTHETLVQFGTIAGRDYKLGVAEYGGTPHIWGFLRASAPDWVTARFDRPGVLAIVLEGAGPLSVFEHGRIHRPADHLVANRWNLEVQLQHLLGNLFAPGVSFLANEMWRHGSGGTLLVVPEDSSTWASDITIAHQLDETSTSVLPELQSRLKAAQSPGQEEPRAALLFESREAARQLTSFTRIDGATVISQSFHLLAFGSKITTKDVPGARPNLMRRTVYESDFSEADWNDLGGTRHQSAARFVAATKQCAAFVCSQDGRLSALAWKSEPPSGHVEWLQGLEGLVIP